MTGHIKVLRTWKKFEQTVLNNNSTTLVRQMKSSLITKVFFESNSVFLLALKYHQNPQYKDFSRTLMQH